jgi:hypothetical protein
MAPHSSRLTEHSCGASHQGPGGWAASIPAPPARSHAVRSSVDPFRARRLHGRIAGVGTFTGWLGLAVAPASKGLIPQPVSMSQQQFRGSSERRSSARHLRSTRTRSNGSARAGGAGSPHRLCRSRSGGARRCFRDNEVPAMRAAMERARTRSRTSDDLQPSDQPAHSFERMTRLAVRFKAPTVGRTGRPRRATASRRERVGKTVTRPEACRARRHEPTRRSRADRIIPTPSERRWAAHHGWTPREAKRKAARCAAVARRATGELPAPADVMLRRRAHAARAGLAPAIRLC